MPTAVITSAGASLDLQGMPKSEVAHFASATLHAVERYFALPGVKEEYEKWLINYKERKKAK